MTLDPIEPEPVQYDRDYVVILSDWSDESAEDMLDNLKKFSAYCNYQKRDAREFLLNAAR